MNKFAAVPLTTILIIGAAMVGAPASANTAGSPPGHLNPSVGCPGNLKTVVPSDAAVAAEGIEAVYKAAGAQRSAKSTHVSKAMKTALSHHPKWISEIHCAPAPGKSSSGGMSNPTPEPATASTTTSGLAATPVDNTNSPNWSGYVLDGVDWDHAYIHQVGGGWSVPYTPPPNSGTNQLSASEWVGIGSGNNQYDQLIQAGTVAYSGPGAGGVGGRGTYPFYEIFPYESEQIPNYPVNSGDVVGASVILAMHTNGTQFLSFAICDASDSTCAAGTQDLPSNTQTSGQQGEWIVERHGFNGHISQLLNFGTASFTDNSYDEAVDQGSSPITDSYTLGVGPDIQAADGVKLHRVNMYDCNNVSPQLDSVGSLVGSTGNFVAVWIRSGTTC